MINQFRSAQNQIDKLRKNMHESPKQVQTRTKAYGTKIFIDFTKDGEAENLFLLAVIMPRKYWKYK